MNNQNKQIIPDLQAVARFIDPETMEVFGSHYTFTIEELFEEINQTSNVPLASEQANAIFKKVRTVSNYGPPEFFREINSMAVEEEESILSAFIDGVRILLLEPNGKGWQKGNLRICFEFTLEEENVTVEKNPEILQASSLDEIRQLANSLLIDQY